MNDVTVEQLTDGQLDEIVRRATKQWQIQSAGLPKLKLDLEHQIGLMACHIIRAYLAVILEPPPLEPEPDEFEADQGDG